MRCPSFARLLPGVAVGLCAVLASAAHAQVRDAPNEQAEPEPKLQWSYGLRLRTSDVTDFSGSTRLRPALGLRYGRWRLGTAEQEDLAAAFVSQKAPSLGYQWVSDQKIDVVASLRLHNISTGEGVEALRGGRYTIRSRVSASQKLSDDWSAFGEGTVDLLRRGDGVTATLGLGRSLYRQPSWALGASAGLIWANSSHWANAYAINGAPRAGMQAGLGGLGLGLGLRGNINKQWSWTAAMITNTPIGPVRRDVTSRSVSSASFGVQRFGP